MLDSPKQAPTPNRVQALHRYGVPSEGAREDLDRLAELGAMVFDVPVALVTLVGEETQWFAATHGADLTEVSVEQSFCASTIQSDGPLVVQDLLADERFSDNRFVTGEPGYRFYAGAPICTSDGYRIGTVCVLDHEPRSPSQQHVRQLRHLADMAMEAMEHSQFTVDDRPELSQTILDHLPGIFYVFGPDARLWRWNAQFEERYDYEPSELRGRKGVSFFEGKDQKHIAKKIRTVFETGCATAEAEFVTGTGEKVPMLFTGVRVRLAGEDHLVGMGVDISERKRVEADLRRSRKKYKSLFEGANDAILVHDMEGRIRDVNSRAEALFGYEKGELVGNSLHDLRPGETREVPDEILAVLRRGEDCELASLYRRADGSQFWGHQKTTTVRMGDETIGRSMIRDVTDKRESERRRKAQMTLFEKIASGTDPDDVLAHLSRFMEDELPGAFVSILTLEDDRLHHRAAPSLPNTYVEVLDGLNVGSAAEIFGLRGPDDRPVVVEDIKTDDRWEGYKETALEAGLRSLWSWAIQSSDGSLLGMFAIYRAEPDRPNSREKQLVQQMDHVASVAIEKERRQIDLRRSEARLRTVVENAQPVVFMLDREGTFMLSEGQDLQSLGLEPGEAVGESAFDLYGEYPSVIQSIETALEGQSVDTELTVEGLIFDCWYSPIWDEDGRVAGCIGMAVDITERRTAQREVERQRNVLQTIFDNIPVMVAFLDEAGSFELINQEFEKTLGWSKEEVEDRLDLLPELFPEPDMMDDVLDFVREAPDEWGEFRVRNRGGEIVPVRAKSVELEEGRRLGIGIDISEQKRRRKRLRLLEAALENSRLPVVIAEAKPGTPVVYTNPVFTEVTGYERKEMLGRSPSILQGPDTDPAALERITKALEREEPVREIVRNYRKDGTPFWNDIYIAPVPNPDGEVTHFVSVHADVSDRVREREELERAKEEAEEANRIKSALLSNMNHEFRTPLTSIISFSELITRKPSLADDFSERILGGGRRLLRTLNTVMDFAELEGGQVSVTPEVFDLRSVASAVAADFEPDAERKGLSLVVDRPAQPVRVSLDRRHVDRICTHLVSNAVKFTDEGTVTVEVGERPDGVEVVVEDTGVGIDPTFQPNVFDEFSQASSGYDRTHEGNGLGLTIVKRLVDLMDGSIDMDSEPGEGTRVAVRLPAKN